MKLYAIEHVPTKRFYTPNTGQFRNGRNWRKNKAVLFTDLEDASSTARTLVQNHRDGLETLRIRAYGGYDSRPEDAVGDGYIRDRDFRIVSV